MAVEINIGAIAENDQPTVSGQIEHVVSMIDDPNYVFFDDKVSYCHSDFNEEIIDDSCIYLDIEYQQWGGHNNGYSTEETTFMISKVDAIAIAKKFNLTILDLSC